MNLQMNLAPAQATFTATELRKTFFQHLDRAVQGEAVQFTYKGAQLQITNRRNHKVVNGWIVRSSPSSSPVAVSLSRRSRSSAAASSAMEVESTSPSMSFLDSGGRS